SGRSAPRSQQVLDVLGDRVGLGADHDLHDRARLHHAVRACLFERGLVDDRAVFAFTAQPRDAASDLHHVARVAEGREDLLRPVVRHRGLPAVRIHCPNPLFACDLVSRRPGPWSGRIPRRRGRRRYGSIFRTNGNGLTPGRATEHSPTSTDWSRPERTTAATRNADTETLTVAPVSR